MEKNIDSKIRKLEEENKRIRELVNECKFEIKKLYLQIIEKKKVIDNIK